MSKIPPSIKEFELNQKLKEEIRQRQEYLIVIGANESELSKHVNEFIKRYDCELIGGVCVSSQKQWNYSSFFYQAILIKQYEN